MPSEKDENLPEALKGEFAELSRTALLLREELRKRGIAIQTIGQQLEHKPEGLTISGDEIILEGPHGSETLPFGLQEMRNIPVLIDQLRSVIARVIEVQRGFIHPGQ